ADSAPVAALTGSSPVGRAVRRSWAMSVGAALDERRFFVLVPFAAIAGAILYVAAGSEPEAWALTAILALCATALVVAWRSLSLVRIVLLAAAVTTGVGIMMAHAALSGTPMLAGSAYGVFEATVSAVLSEGEGQRRVILRDIR